MEVYRIQSDQFAHNSVKKEFKIGDFDLADQTHQNYVSDDEHCIQVKDPSDFYSPGLRPQITSPKGIAQINQQVFHPSRGISTDEHELEMVNRSLQSYSIEKPKRSNLGQAKAVNEYGLYQISPNQSPANQSGPLPIYQMFFENMEMMRTRGQSLVQLQSPKNEFTTTQSHLRRAQTSGNKSSVSRRSQMNQSINHPLDTSIRNIIDEGIQDIFDNTAARQENVTRSFYAPMQKNNDDGSFGHSLARNECPTVATAECPFNDYIDLSDFPLYTHNPFLLYLKATSLFSSSLIFENDLLTILCKTEKVHYENGLEIALHLTYHAKQAGIKISANFKNTEHITSYPSFIYNIDLSQDLEHSFVLQNFGQIRISDFPPLSVELTVRKQTYAFQVPLPFSINKYTQSLSISKDDVVHYLGKVS